MSTLTILIAHGTTSVSDSLRNPFATTPNAPCNIISRFKRIHEIIIIRLALPITASTEISSLRSSFATRLLFYKWAWNAIYHELS